jgi:hypothetical protein
LFLFLVCFGGVLGVLDGVVFVVPPLIPPAGVEKGRGDEGGTTKASTLNNAKNSLICQNKKISNLATPSNQLAKNQQNA